MGRELPLRCVGLVSRDWRTGRSRIVRPRFPIFGLDMTERMPERFVVTGGRGAIRRAGFKRPHPRLVTQLADHHVQRLTINKLHGIEMDAALAANAMHRNDVCMVKVGRSLRLLPESLQMLGIKGGRKRQHLQGHAAPQGQLNGLVHNAHAATANLAHDLEIPEGICQKRFSRVAREPW